MSLQELPAAVLCLPSEQVYKKEAGMKPAFPLTLNTRYYCELLPELNLRNNYSMQRSLIKHKFHN